MAVDFCVARVLFGEAVSTSPEHALAARNGTAVMRPIRS
jgi:hypothetical protein